MMEGESSEARRIQNTWQIHTERWMERDGRKKDERSDNGGMYDVGAIGDYGATCDIKRSSSS